MTKTSRPTCALIDAIKQDDPVKALGELALGARCEDDPACAGSCALGLAARIGSIACLLALTRQGLPLDHAGDMGWTPLLHAAASGHADCVRHLLATGADPLARNVFGVDAAGLAAKWATLDCLKPLIEAGSGRGLSMLGSNIAMGAASRGQLDALKYLATVGLADFEQRRFDGADALSLARAAPHGQAAAAFIESCLLAKTVDRQTHQAPTAKARARMRP
jgi:ankyrin repeat protein